MGLSSSVPNSQTAFPSLLPSRSHETNNKPPIVWWFIHVYTIIYHPFMVNMGIVFHCSTSITAITGGRAFFWLHSIWMCLKMGHWALATASFREIIIIRWIYMEDLFPQYYVPLYPHFQYPHFQISCHTICTCSILYQINYYSFIPKIN